MSELRILIAVASAAAEKVFRKDGHIKRAIWHAVKATGEHLLIPAEAPTKDLQVAMLRGLFEQQNVVRYVQFMEAWRVEDDMTDAEIARVKAQYQKHGLATHPNRCEILFFGAEDQNEGFMMAAIHSTRPRQTSTRCTEVPSLPRWRRSVHGIAAIKRSAKLTQTREGVAHDEKMVLDGLAVFRRLRRGRGHHSCRPPPMTRRHVAVEALVRRILEIVREHYVERGPNRDVVFEVLDGLAFSAGLVITGTEVQGEELDNLRRFVINAMDESIEAGIEVKDEDDDEPEFVGRKN